VGKTRTAARALAGGVLASLVLGASLGSAPALADDDAAPPGVARISLLNGDVDVQRADSGDPLAAAINAPVLVGDYVTTGDDSRSEVQFDSSTVVRLASDTQVRFTRMDPDGDSLQVAAGTVEVAVLHPGDAHAEIDTPSVALRPRDAGDYRVTVTDEGSTQITVRRGRADAMLPAGPQSLTTAGTMVLQGSPSNPQVQFVAALGYDAFDRWNADRDQQIEAATSGRYAGEGIVGASDLDPYGRWVDQSGYGNVWVPTVAQGWAPYRDGRWVWEPYYGWTWVSQEPWGWAPYHYGRWFFAAGTGWCWYPGPVAVRPVWQPALVAFVGFGGGFGFSLGFGNVGWVPLAPFEPYHPWWGPRYANRTTVVHNYTNITNITNVTNVTTYHYRNLLVRNAVTGVPAQDFAAGRFDRRLPVEPARLNDAKLVNGPLPVVPGAQNLRLSERKPSQTAHSEAIQRNFRTFAAPLHQAAPFEQQRASMQTVTRRLYPERPAGHDDLTPATQHIDTLPHAGTQLNSLPHGDTQLNSQPHGDTLQASPREGKVHDGAASADSFQRGNRHAFDTVPASPRVFHPAADEPYVNTPASHAHAKPKTFVTSPPAHHAQRAPDGRAEQQGSKDRDER
jgi:hypothetical protein